LALTNIYLARHGETEYNRCDQLQGRGIDASLNKKGLHQARAIARHLQGIQLHGIFSSSLKRSKETAAVIAEIFNLQVVSHKDLDEIDFGIFEGRPVYEIKTELQDLHQKWKSGHVDYACENGESPRTVLKRAGNRIETIIENHKNTNLLFVLHGRLIRILLSHWLRFGLSDMHRVPHSNGALYHIRWDGESFESVYLNKTEHLDSKIEVES
jgi:probable phosphoglycerate mutase